MAIIRLSDSSTRAVPHDKAVAIWKVISGEEQGSEEQVAFARRVTSVHMDWHNAPQSYIEAHRDVIAALAKREGVTLDILPETALESVNWFDKD